MAMVREADSERADAVADREKADAEIARLRDVLHDIANAHASEADQCPYWARKAICAHEKLETHRSGIVQCAWCWEPMPTPRSSSPRDPQG